MGVVLLPTPSTFPSTRNIGSARFVYSDTHTHTHVYISATIWTGGNYTCETRKERPRKTTRSRNNNPRRFEHDGLKEIITITRSKTIKKIETLSKISSHGKRPTLCTRRQGKVIDFYTDKRYCVLFAIPRSRSITED